MLVKQLTSRLVRASQKMTALPVARFSAEKKEAAAEWGIKYDDECLKFEKEWKVISEKVD